MNYFVQKPNLPSSKVSLLAVSNQYPSVIDDLHTMGIQTIVVPPCPDLDAPVAAHADMLMHHLGGNQMVMYPYDKQLVQDLSDWGFELSVSDANLAQKYPGDVSFNYCRIGNLLIGNFKRAQPELFIEQCCLEQKIHFVHINQGYAKCSICVVDEHSVVTSDATTAQILKGNNIDVLLIRSGHIVLDGYDTGLIGGCCGKLSQDTLYFTGCLTGHPDAQAIRKFVVSKGVTILEGSSEKLVDVGSVLPLIQNCSP